MIVRKKEKINCMWLDKLLHSADATFKSLIMRAASCTCSILKLTLSSGLRALSRGSSRLSKLF